jgi:hypothetical protein
MPPVAAVDPSSNLASEPVRRPGDLPGRARRTPLVVWIGRKWRGATTGSMCCTHCVAVPHLYLFDEQPKLGGDTEGRLTRRVRTSYGFDLEAAQKGRDTNADAAVLSGEQHPFADQTQPSGA